MTIDQAADQLHRDGWSTGTICILDRDHGPLWVVDASRGDQVIRCRALLAVLAWDAAVSIAERLG